MWSEARTTPPSLAGGPWLADPRGGTKAPSCLGVRIPETLEGKLVTPAPGVSWLGHGSATPGPPRPQQVGAGNAGATG